MTGIFARIGLSAGVLLLLGAAPWAGEIAPTERRSGFDFMSRDTQAMQQDDGVNPGMLWVREGEGLWQTKTGPEGRACTDCHGDARTSMRGVAARYPAYSPEHGRPITLEERINQCRETRQGAAPLAWESQELLALTAYVATQSRGLTLASADDPRLGPFRESGRRIFEQRQGQLNLSCSLCHDDNWGRRLGGSVIPQGHPTGYPLYRLEWQGLGSLQRRLRNCLIGMRAEPYPYGAPEFAALEIYLKERAGGLAVDSPAVRP